MAKGFGGQHWGPRSSRMNFFLKTGASKGRDEHDIIEHQRDEAGPVTKYKLFFRVFQTWERVLEGWPPMFPYACFWRSSQKSSPASRAVP